MPCINISNLLRWNNGVLQGRDDCCNWVDIPGWSGSVESPVADNPGANQDPPLTYSACGAAAAIVDAIYLVGNGMFQATDESPVWLPFGVSIGWVAAVKDYAYPLELKTAYVVEGVLICSGLKADNLDQEEVFDLPTKQAIICRLARGLKNPGQALTDADFNTIDAAFNMETGFADSGIFGAAANALGKTQISNIGITGSMDDTRNCECPDAEGAAPYLSWNWPWMHVMDFTARSIVPTHYGINSGEGQWGLTADGYSANGFWSDADTQYRRVKVDVAIEQEGGTIRNLAFKIKRALAMSWYSDPSILVSGTQYGDLADCPDQDPSAGEYVWWSVDCSEAADMGQRPIIDLPAQLDAHYNEKLFAAGVVAIAIGGQGTDIFNTDPNA